MADHALSYDAVMALLAQLQENSKTIVTVVPPDAEIIEVDLNKRVIDLNHSAYSKFLSVERDHYAETVYFKVPRYFDDVDLLRMCCVVEYVNANGDARVAPIMVKDVTTEPGYIIFGWCIHGDATRYPGKVRFAIRFFAIDLSKHEFVYSLRTQQATATVLYGIDEAITKQEGLSSQSVYDVVEALQEQAVVYWTNM